MGKEEEEEILRIELPKEGEVFGIVEIMLGGDKMKVECDDGYKRICRIPGRLRKKVWIRPGDLVVVQPWKTEPKEKGDVVNKYTPTQANWIKNKGLIKRLSF